MADNKTIVETPRTSTAPQTRETETVLTPPTDICEDADGILLWADMPGVSTERLSLQVDRDTLTIEGESSLDMAEGMKPLYADIRTVRYRRRFALSGELDTDNIDASLKDGVLHLRIPKKPESKPRKIEVRMS